MLPLYVVCFRLAIIRFSICFVKKRSQLLDIKFNEVSLLYDNLSGGTYYYINNNGYVKIFNSIKLK